MADAGVFTAALGNPDIVFRRRVNGAGRTPFAADIAPARLRTIRMGCVNSRGHSQQQAAHEKLGFGHAGLSLVDKSNDTVAIVL